MKIRPGFFGLMVTTVLFGCFGVVNALAWPVPDSGQTKCYNNAEEIPCPAPGEDFYGQDSQYAINPMSYTKLDATGNVLPDDAASWVMVRDNVTGLIWEKKQNRDDVQDYSNPHDADNTYSWYDSNPATNDGDAGTPGDGINTFDTEQFINALNAANYGDHNDWRIPTIKEMNSINNYGLKSPAINSDFFPNTADWCYWSSINNFYGSTGASWAIMSSGSCFGLSKSNPANVRAVCGGQSEPLDHFVNNGDGTVTDIDTGLMWQQEDYGPITWESALSSFENSNLSGYSDWRLPSVKELRSLLDFSHSDPIIDTQYFPDTALERYWSSNTSAYFANSTLVIGFGNGANDVAYDKCSSYFARAVRGGQAGPLGHSVVLSPRQASSWETGSIMPIRWQTFGLGANVKISLSRQGGKAGTFETIITSTPNDGQEDWTISGAGSVNCVIKIEQADNPANWTTEGLFVIKSALKVNPAIYLLLLE